MARYSGNGSWDNLLVKNYGKNITGNLSGTNEADNGIKYLPISLLRAGYYGDKNGEKLWRTAEGHYWLPRNGTPYKRRLYFDSSSFKAIDSMYGGRGNSVRCVAKIATDSICPKGWEMARGSGNKSYEILTNIYTKITLDAVDNSQASNGIHDIPFNIPSSGYYNYNNGSQTNRGIAGRYWTIYSTVSAGSARNFFFSQTYFSYRGSNPKKMGYSVRWDAKSPLLFLKQARRKTPTLLILFVPKGGRWQDMKKIKAGDRY